MYSHNTGHGHSEAFKAELIMVIIVTILIIVTVRLLRHCSHNTGHCSHGHCGHCSHGHCSHNTDHGHSQAFKAELIMVTVVTILIMVTVRLLRQN